MDVNRANHEAAIPNVARSRPLLYALPPAREDVVGGMAISLSLQAARGASRSARPWEPAQPVPRAKPKARPFPFILDPDIAVSPLPAHPCLELLASRGECRHRRSHARLCRPERKRVASSHKDKVPRSAQEDGVAGFRSLTPFSRVRLCLRLLARYHVGTSSPMSGRGDALWVRHCRSSAAQGGIP